MWKVTFLVISAFCFASGCLYKKKECPDYIVTEHHPDYEIRSYPEITWVTTTEPALFPKPAKRTAFQRLLLYMKGENDKQLRLAMTVPVRMLNSRFKNGTLLQMSFMVPSEIEESPPLPANGKVTIQKENPTTYVVRSFKSYILTEARWKKEAQKLANSVKNDETVDKVNFYQVEYDKPYKPFGRRNEIWMVKKIQYYVN